MRTRTVMALALALASTGCRKQEPAREAPAGSGAPAAPGVAPAVAPADAATAPAVDAGSSPADDAGAGDAGAGDAGVDDAGVAEAPWPKAIGVETISIDKQLSNTFRVEVSVPRFRIKPGALAAELNARFAQHTKLKAADYKGYEGSYYASCQPRLVSRFAVIVECGEMTDMRTHAEAREGTGGAPAGPTPSLVAVWLQPGLPAIELSQLAPGIDAAQVIAKAIKGSPTGCNPDWCEYKPEAFSLDEDGIVFRPFTYCSSECPEEHRPRIPLDQLHPTHPWAVQLVGWIKQRVDASQGLVEGKTEP